VTQELFATELASSLKDIYWDVRPKPEFGTVEIRVFDTPLSVSKAVAMAAFARACASLAMDGNLSISSKSIPTTAQRVSRFLACKDAMDAVLYNPFVGEWMPARTWLAQVFSALEVQRIYAVDAAHLEFLKDLIGNRQDHEIMRATWSDIQARNLTPENFTWSLPNYSSELCALLV
jgi:carboxylate-amine ligase